MKGAESNLSEATLKRLRKTYDQYEDRNEHMSNYLLLATFFGTDADKEEVKKIMARRNRRGYLTAKENTWLYQNINPYYDHLRNVKVEGYQAESKYCKCGNEFEYFGNLWCDKCLEDYCKECLDYNRENDEFICSRCFDASKNAETFESPSDADLNFKITCPNCHSPKKMRKIDPLSDPHDPFPKYHKPIFYCLHCGGREGKMTTAQIKYDLKSMDELNPNWEEVFPIEKYRAETFNVEFNEWADQEMLTHGQDISFRDWAKDEGKKHGNVPITDWAEHEEESHDERYGAETFGAESKKTKYGMIAAGIITAFALLPEIKKRF